MTDATTNEMQFLRERDCRCGGDVSELRGARALMAERGADYGPPADNMRRTAQIWSAILDVPVTPRQVALCMVGVKLARDAHKPKGDNHADGDAYWTIAGDLS